MTRPHARMTCALWSRYGDENSCWCGRLKNLFVNMKWLLYLVHCFVYILCYLTWNSNWVLVTYMREFSVFITNYSDVTPRPLLPSVIDRQQQLHRADPSSQRTGGVAAQLSPVSLTSPGWQLTRTSSRESIESSWRDLSVDLIIRALFLHHPAESEVYYLLLPIPRP